MLSGPVKVLRKGLSLAIVLLVAVVLYAAYTIEGSDADKQTFLDMLTAARNGSPEFKTEYDAIFNAATPSITYKVGRSQPNVIVDSFASNKVDLDDLEKFPASPPAGHPDALTRAQLIKHFMSERWHKANNPAATFEDSHNQAITDQNKLRTEAGQHTVTSQVGSTNADGSVTGTITYSDGNTETWTISSTGTITSIVYH